MPVIPFGPDELANTRFAASPLAHLVHGVHAGPCSTGSGLRERWWATARRQVPAIALPLIQLINIDALTMPDFLVSPTTPALGAYEPTLDEELAGLEASWTAAPVRLVGASRDLPRVARELADGSPQALSRFIDAVRALFGACLAADWPAIRNQLHGDLASRALQMMTGGPGRVLATLHPGLDWKDDKLIFGEALLPKAFTEAHGGLTLMPCAFGTVGLHPLLAGPNRRVLVYSAKLRLEVPAEIDTLAVLIGAGRARTLRALVTPGSTSTLAARLSVTAPTASAHATVLRQAGLNTTRRDGQQVQHELTPVGAALLVANPPARRR